LYSPEIAIGKTTKKEQLVRDLGGWRALPFIPVGFLRLQFQDPWPNFQDFKFGTIDTTIKCNMFKITNKINVYSDKYHNHYFYIENCMSYYDM
jgi:hypothetical protein